MNWEILQLLAQPLVELIRVLVGDSSEDEQLQAWLRLQRASWDAKARAKFSGPSSP